MSTDYQTIITILEAVLGGTARVIDLIRRVQNGETISDEEIAEVRAEYQQARADWDAAAEHDRA